MIAPIAPLFIGDFAGHRGSFLLAEEMPTHAELVGGRWIASEEGMGDMLDRFGRLHPAASRRAIASQWARAWAGRLLPVVITASLVLNHELPIAMDDIAVKIDEYGRPLAFAVRHPGHRYAPVDHFERFELLVHGHFGPLFQRAAANAQIAPRVLYGQVGFLFGWLVDLARAHPLAKPEPNCHGHALLESPRWGDGRANPLYRPIVTIHEGGETHRRKRVCCLSHELERDAGPCPMCPLPAAKSKPAGGGKRPDNSRP